MRRLILSSLLLALAAPAMAGSIYKWVDAQGTTHFGTQPPQGVEAQRVNPVISQPATPAPAAPASPASEAANAGAAKQAEIEKDVKAQIAAEQERLESHCLQVRTNLAQLQNNPRVRVEENGETRRLTEEERQSRIAEAQKTISENCE